MLENLSLMMNFTEYFRIALTRDEWGVIGEIETIFNNAELKEQFHATDIYDFFAQLSMFADQDLDYKEFRNKFYSLTTIDQLEICNDGACRAVSKANRRAYLERYDYHNNMEEYFSMLQNHITTYQDYNSPIVSLEKGKDF